MAIEIANFPINSMVIFQSYVNVYQRVMVMNMVMIWWFHGIGIWIYGDLMSISWWFNRGLYGDQLLVMNMLMTDDCD